MKIGKNLEDFINKLEFFYRNFGSKWNLMDFIDARNKNDEIILSECLKNLKKKGVVKIISDNYD